MFLKCSKETSLGLSRVTSSLKACWHAFLYNKNWLHKNFFAEQRVLWSRSRPYWLEPETWKKGAAPAPAPVAAPALTRILRKKKNVEQSYNKLLCPFKWSAEWKHSLSWNKTSIIKIGSAMLQSLLTTELVLELELELELEPQPLSWLAGAGSKWNGSTTLGTEILLLPYAGRAFWICPLQ